MDMPNLVGDFTVEDYFEDYASSIALSGANEVVSYVIDGVTYLFVASYSDGVQVLSIDANGQMEAVDSFFDGTGYELNGANDLVVYENDGQVYLSVSTVGDDAIVTFAVSDDGDEYDGHLTFQSAYDLTNPYTIEHVDIGGEDFLIATSNSNDGIYVYQQDGDGTLTLTDTVLDADDEDYELDSPYGLHVETIGGTTYVFAGSDSASEGFSIFTLNGSGTLTSLQDFSFVNGTYANSFEVATINGVTYLYVGESNYNPIGIYALDSETGLFAHSGSYDYNDAGYGYRLHDFQEIVLNGVTFLAATTDSNGVVLFSIGDDGMLEATEAIFDAVYLDNSDWITHVSIDGHEYIISSNADDSALTTLEISGGDDAIKGTGENDTLHGLAGDDELLGYAGSDDIYGGLGEDVLSGRKGNDKLYGGEDDDILLGHQGRDTLEGGDGADIMIGGSSEDTLSYESSDAGVTIDLDKGTASGGHADGDIFLEMENITGSSYDDYLKGDDGDNTLKGLAGNDTLYAYGGDDTVEGGSGRDRIKGGDGADDLSGGKGKDALFGGDGDDTLIGGDGHDRLEGGNDNDIIEGDTGRDRITGGAGNDTMTGGADADTFMFGDNFGADVITDFENGEDLLDFSDHSSLNSLADVLDAAVEFSGNTIIIDGSNSIVLTGVSMSELDASDFVF